MSKNSELKWRGGVVKNDLLIRTLKKEPIERIPVWIMRQAGRYLPEYRALKRQAKNFLDFCKTPELASQATLQPIERFELDAAILFSDILVIPEAMRLGLQFEAGLGPYFEKPVRDASDLAQLFVPDPEQDLGYVLETIRLAKKSLDQKVPLIGFSGSPWTIATYMIEGQPSKNFSVINKMRFSEPQWLHQILSVLTESIILYLNAQIRAGVDVVMLFDTWGGILSKPDYLTYSLYYMKKILAGLEKQIPTILFTKNGGRYLSEIANTHCHAIGLDWTADLKSAYQAVGSQVVLQGNLEPGCLYASDEIIVQRVQDILKVLPPGAHHIFNLGHGILPDIEPEKVSVMVQAVRQFGKI